MSELICNGEYPEQLFSLAQQWQAQDREFCLSPVNIFKHNFISINYQGAENVSRDLGAWSIHTPDCISPSTLTTSDIDQVAYHFGKDLEFEFAIMFIGKKCNLHCRFCMYHGDTSENWLQNYSKQSIEVDMATIKSRVDKLVELGIKAIQFVPNGELFVYSEWEEMIRYAQSKGLAVRILFSNGTLLNEETIKKLAELDIQTLSVSVNAFKFETWSKITGATNKKLFDTVTEAPLLAQKYGIKTEVSIVVCSETQHEIKDFISYWRDKCDILKIVQEVNNGDICAGLSKVNNSFLPYYLCGDLRRRLVIGNNGDIYPCCAMSSYEDDENTYDILSINIDSESSEQIIKFMNSCYEKKSYAKICKTCTLVRVPQVDRQKATYYNFEGEITGNFFFVKTEKGER